MESETPSWVVGIELSPRSKGALQFARWLRETLHARVLGVYVSEMYMLGVPPSDATAFLLAMRSEGEAAWAALHRAATSSGFHDYFGTSYASYAKAIESAGAEPPGLVAGVARALAPGASVTSTVAEYEAWAMPMPRFQRIIDLCQPEKLPAAHPQARADCQEIGQRMARAQGGLITNMIGSVIARRLGKGTPLEAEMKAVRARYLYLTDVYSALSHAELLGYGPERVREDSMQFGEMEAYARVAAHFGKPTTPPADWAPKDPQALLLPEERAR